MQIVIIPVGHLTALVEMGSVEMALLVKVGALYAAIIQFTPHENLHMKEVGFQERRRSGEGV